jgi:F-type H+-transporting ATPase subunit delta
MIERTLARRYATAMLAVSLKEGNVAQVRDLLLSLKGAYSKDAAFRGALAQPRIPKAARKELLRKPFEGNAPESFLKLLDLLVDKHRVRLIPDLAESFDELADESRGVVRAQVASTFPLTPAQEKRLLEVLKAATGKIVEMTVAVDRGLEGGLSVRIGDRVLDGTIVNRVKGLRERVHVRAAL